MYISFRTVHVMWGPEGAAPRAPNSSTHIAPRAPTLLLNVHYLSLRTYLFVRYIAWVTSRWGPKARRQGPPILQLKSQITHLGHRAGSRMRDLITSLKKSPAAALHMLQRKVQDTQRYLKIPEWSKKDSHDRTFSVVTLPTFYESSSFQVHFPNIKS
jgi:hypothetical protein